MVYVEIEDPNITIGGQPNTIVLFQILMSVRQRRLPVYLVNCARMKIPPPALAALLAPQAGLEMAIIVTQVGQQSRY